MAFQIEDAAAGGGIGRTRPSNVEESCSHTVAQVQAKLHNTSSAYERFYWPGIYHLYGGG